MVNIQLLNIWRQESNFHRLSPVLFKREHFPNCALQSIPLFITKGHFKSLGTVASMNEGKRTWAVLFAS